MSSSGDARKTGGNVGFRWRPASYVCNDGGSRMQNIQNIQKYAKILHYIAEFNNFYTPSINYQLCRFAKKRNAPHLEHGA